MLKDFCGIHIYTLYLFLKDVKRRELR
jgi:hypothetical protein